MLQLISELNALVSQITSIIDKSKSSKVFENCTKELSKIIADINTSQELYSQTQDQEIITEIESHLISLKSQLQEIFITALMPDETDAYNCYIEIHSGAGGMDAQEWARMLTETYVKYAAKAEFKCHINEYNSTEKNCIRSSTTHIAGKNAYGLLKRETGVHRLVRISPFDSNSRRHTSFASVYVYPEVDKTIKINLDEKDLRIDTYRSSGAGGQHVNKTESAVRITHIPTGIAVQSQSDRSQHRNKSIAMNMLISKLHQYEKTKQISNQREKEDIKWGNQIRSYTLNPYQLVKDDRSDYKTTQVASILNGDISEMLMHNLISIREPI